MTVEASVDHEMIRRMYDAYNSRALQTLTAFLSQDVEWPDGERRLHGKAAVRDYWWHQWTQYRTHDEVTGINTPSRGRATVLINQVVRNPAGVILSVGRFEHIYEFHAGLVIRMYIHQTQSLEDTKLMVDHETLIRRLYAGFNQRNIPEVLEVLAENVEWANGMDGGHVHGREAVRAYWTKQWAAIQPQVDPLQIAQRADGAMAVEVHQVVRDMAGETLLDERVRHVFRIEKGLVTRFDIENAGGLAAIAHAEAGG